MPADTLPVVAPVITAGMEKFLEAFRLYLREEVMRRPTTVRRYVDVATEFAAFLRTGGIDRTLDSIDRHTVVAFLRQTCAAPPEQPSPSAWNMRLAALRSLFRYLCEEDLMLLNPALRVDRQRMRRQRPIVPLTLDEFVSMYKAVDSAAERYRKRDRAILLTFFCDLFRVAELARLDVGHVHLQEHLFLDLETKGGKKLSVEMPDIVADALEQYLAERHENFGPSVGEPALFLSNRGTRLSIRTVEAMVKRYALEAGITRPVFPHLLRHTGSTELSEQGETLQTIGSLAGQDSIETTKRYTHVRERTRRLAVERLGRRLKRRLAERKGGGWRRSQKLRVTGITRNRKAVDNE